MGGRLGAEILCGRHRNAHLGELDGHPETGGSNLRRREGRVRVGKDAQGIWVVSGTTNNPCTENDPWGTPVPDTK